MHLIVLHIRGRKVFQIPGVGQDLTEEEVKVLLASAGSDAPK